jgi:hypothetical protein
MSIKLNSSGGGSVTLQEPVTANTLTLTLPAFSGTAATLASVTNNGVLFVNGSGQPTSGSALTFDGANLVLGGAQRINGTSTSGLTLTSNSGSTSGFKLYNDSGTDIAYLMNYYNGSMVFGINNSEQMRLTSTGLGIGTSSPTAKLDVYREMRVTQGLAEYRFRITNTDGNGRLLVDGDASSLIFGTSGAGFGATATERMRIDSSGNLLVGTPNPVSGSSTFLVNSAKSALTLANGATADSTVLLSCIKAGATNNTSQRYIGFFYNGGVNGNGAIAGNGDSQATFITLSDERLKENIENLPTQLANIMALRPVEFDYKATGGHQIGFIAQEVQTVYPDLVADGDDGYLTLAGFDKNTARLIKAIQEQQAIITQLQSDINLLKGTL